MTQICYTIGYTGRKLSEIVAVLDERDAILFDIRYSPRSRNPTYNQGYLVAALKERYVWVKALGNINYNVISPIRIADYDSGKAQIAACPKPAILMCVCENAATCHRTVVADLLRRDGFAVEEIGRVHQGGIQLGLIEE